MSKIEIDNIIAENDFEEGKSIQLRAAADDEQVYAKHSLVMVSHRGIETQARIVAEPLLISSATDDDMNIYSLIVEKV